jgi:hypothetical protein
MANESAIQREIRLALGRRTDVVLWRNNAGIARHGESRVVYGLCVGSADLIGLYCPTGQFLAIEIKKPGGKQTEEQRLFGALVRRSGGLYAVVHSVDEAIVFLEGLKK